MVKVSIIVPIYNQEKYLDCCIKSLLNQNYEQYEIIFINDGSTDASEEICATYLEDSRIKYIYQDNKGLGPARNTGLKVASGKYVMFVDSDDAVEYNSLRGLVKFVEENHLDIAYFDELVCDEDMLIKNVNATCPNMCTKIEKICALRYCMQPSHICARIYKRELFEHIQFSNIWYEDMESFPKLLSKAIEIGYYKVPIYKYRQHNGAITHNDVDVRNRDVLKAWGSAIEIKELSAEEKEAIKLAVLDSVTTFCFFKPNFAHDYIEWCKTNIFVNISSDTIELADVEKDYPFKHQAEAKSDEILNTLEMIEDVYVRGGFSQVSWVDYVDEVCIEEGLYFKVVDGRLKLVGINFASKSIVLGEALKQIQTQNLVSLSGKIKEGLLDSIVLNKALLHNSNVCIIR